MSYLSRMGLKVTEGPSPLVLKFSGHVKTIEKAFGVRVNVYAEKANESFYSADADPTMPQNFVPVVGGIQGLNNYTHSIPAQQSCYGPYCPQGIQLGYSLSSLYGNGYDGTGQKVAIVDVPLANDPFCFRR
jgi:subtilase family serine protease